jgi:hypothetical protein
MKQSYFSEANSIFQHFRTQKESADFFWSHMNLGSTLPATLLVDVDHNNKRYFSFVYTTADPSIGIHP